MLYFTVMERVLQFDVSINFQFQCLNKKSKCFVKIVNLIRNFTDEEQEECTAYTIAVKVKTTDEPPDKHK